MLSSATSYYDRSVGHTWTLHGLDNIHLHPWPSRCQAQHHKSRGWGVAHQGGRCELYIIYIPRR